jgi:stage II sporulation protein D
MTKRTALALIAALAVLLTAGGPARADFDFIGSGYGHGIGMSQYGALGLAKVGWGPARIVKHYFKTTHVGKRPPPNPRIKVGILQYKSSVKLIATGGSFELKLKNGKHVDTVANNQSRTISIHGGQYRVKKPNGDTVGNLWGGTSNHMLALRNGTARIRVPAWGHQVRRGKLQFDIVSNTKAHLLGVMPVEQYVFGVSEVPSSWPMRALKAQAIMARTYAYWRLAGPLHGGCSCDVFTTTVDQAYTGWTKESSPGGNRWVAAVNQTHRKVLTHSGNYVYTPYSSSSGGHTENIENVWPGASPASWLKGVCDPRDDVPENPNTTWSASLSAATVTSKLKPYTGDIGTVQNFTAYDRGVSGRVTHVKVVGSSGSKVVEGWDIRSALGLKDTRFSVDRNLNITGRVRDKYDKVNCHPGRAMAPKLGIAGGAWQRFLKGRIYVNFSADKEVWIRGPVLDKYRDEGAHHGPLGLPVSYQKLADGTKGVFDHGTIVCNAGCTVTYGPA